MLRRFILLDLFPRHPAKQKDAIWILKEVNSKIVIINEFQPLQRQPRAKLGVKFYIEKFTLSLRRPPKKVLQIPWVPRAIV